MVYSARRFVVCLTLCHFVLVFFSPLSIAIISFGEERANLNAFRTFDRFVLVWICRFPLPLDVWEGLRFEIVAPPGFFSYLFYMSAQRRLRSAYAQSNQSLFFALCGFLRTHFLCGQRRLIRQQAEKYLKNHNSNRKMEDFSYYLLIVMESYSF